MPRPRGKDPSPKVKPKCAPTKASGRSTAKLPEQKPERTGRTHKGILKEAKLQAAMTGLLPHEWLLRVMRGEAIEQRYWLITRDKKGNEVNRELKIDVVYADFGTRMDAAKAAAPYFAARLATQIIAMPTGDEDGSGFAGLDLAGLHESELKTVKKVLMSAVARGLKGGE